MQIKSKRILFSDEAWAAKVTIPITAIVFYIWMLISASTVRFFIARAILYSPFLAIALWGIFVPWEVEVNESESFLTVINWRSSIQIQLSDIAYIQRRISVFDTIKTKSGKKFLYITCRANKALRTE